VERRAPVPSNPEQKDRRTEVRKATQRRTIAEMAIEIVRTSNILC
jgi:hypothetical protein